MADPVSSTSKLSQSNLMRDNKLVSGQTDVSTYSTICKGSHNNPPPSFIVEPKSPALFNQDAEPLSPETAKFSDLYHTMLDCHSTSVFIQSSPDSTQNTLHVSVSSLETDSEEDSTKQREETSWTVSISSNEAAIERPFRTSTSSEASSVKTCGAKADSPANISSDEVHNEMSPLKQAMGNGLDTVVEAGQQDDPHQTPSSVANNGEKSQQQGAAMKLAGSKVSQFEPKDVLSFRHGLMVLVHEESVMRHRMEENEAKIRQLVSSNSTLEKEQDLLQKRLKQQEAHFESSMAETKRLFGEKLAIIKMEERYMKMLKIEKEEQSELLRQEATKLQLVNYRQEQKIQELEAKVKSQEGVSGPSTVQWVEYQKKLTDLTKLYNVAAATVSRLEQSDQKMSGMLDAIEIVRKIEKVRPQLSGCCVNTKM